MEERRDEVPYIAHESMLARMERQSKRLWVVIIITIAALILTNGAWLYAWLQYDYCAETEITAEQDGKGINIVGGGDVRFGSESYYTEEANEDTKER